MLKKYGLKGTIAVRHHSTLCCNISSGPIDFIGNMYEIALTRPETFYARDRVAKPTYLDVNPYYIHDQYTGPAKDCLLELKAAMMEGNFDNSDIQTDYFHVGWYIDINLGRWNKPYILTAQ